MIIKSLSQENIDEVVEIANKSFPGEIESEVSPRLSCLASLYPGKHQDHWKKFRLNRLEYFVAFDEVTNKVVGASGLYEKNTDLGKAWLSWFFIDPEQRGKGFGEELLRWTIDKARSHNYKALRLYTSTDPEESMAQNLYEKVGLKIIDDSKISPDNASEIRRLVPKEYNVIFREIVLN